MLEEISVIKLKKHLDERGFFQKTYNSNIFHNDFSGFEIKESFITESHKNVIRGMHFQLPNHTQKKIVTCVTGSAVDVVLDIRKESASYGKFQKFYINGNDDKNIFIPEGFAHGFLALEDKTLINYLVSEGYKADSDYGIRWDSFGCDWNVTDPIISHRDKQHAKFLNFESPF